MTFSWSLNSPTNSNASLSDPSAEKPTFTPDVAGDYTASLQVSDGEASDTDDATVTGQSDVVEIGSDITSDRTLTADEKYVVTTSCVGIEEGATLTLEPGTTLKFQAGTCLEVNDDNAALVASGTDSDPITMAATSGNEQPGWWKGVAFFSNNANNTLDYVDIRHAGSDNISTSIDEAANIAIGNGARVTLSNSTVADGAGYGIYDAGSSDGSLDGFSANSFSNNADGPMWIPFDAIGAIDAGSSFADGTSVRVDEARLNNDATLNALNGNTPYQISGRGEINATLTVEPGVEFTFENGAALEVLSESALIADGTSDSPITMTATSGNEQQGWWKGVAFFSNNVDNTLNYVDIRHAGSDNISTSIDEAANIAIGGDSQLSLSNSTITDSGNHGVFCQASSSTLSASTNTFNNNAGENIRGCSQ